MANLNVKASLDALRAANKKVEMSTEVIDKTLSSVLQKISALQSVIGGSRVSSVLIKSSENVSSIRKRLSTNLGELQKFMDVQTKNYETVQMGGVEALKTALSYIQERYGSKK